MSGVFVTGATGIVGSAVVGELLARGQRVIAGVRGRAALPPGVRARQFDFGATPGEFETVLEGADRLFLMRPPQIEDVRTFLFPLIDAARRRGIRRVVFLSLQGVQANRRTPHHAVEQYLRELRAPYTFLRPNFFMQNLSSTYRDDIRMRSAISLPAGRSFTALIDARDIGAAAATVFTEAGHLRKAYTLSGEQSLSYRRVAGILSDVLGRPIAYERPSEREYLERLTREGRQADYVAVQKMIYRIVRLNVSAFPNRTVRRITGRPARRFEEFASDYRHVWESEPGRSSAATMER